MKIAIIGSGGREHALVNQLSISKKITKIYSIPGNAGTKEISTNIDLNLENFRELYDFINSTKEKFDLKLGEKGVRLSGGQLQRIGIARALYNKSEIIFLDEATSALDNKTEKKIISRLNALGNNITLIMIAHRLSSLSSCNKILELKGGV